MNGVVQAGLRRIARGACVALTIAGLSGCSLLTPTLSEVESTTVEQAIDDALLVQAGTLTVAVNTSDAPQAMTDSDGDVVGYAVDVAAALAERLGLSLSVVVSSSPSDTLEAGEADLYIGVSSSSADDSISVLGDYLESATGVFAITDDTSVTLDDINSATVGVQASSASQEVLAYAGGTGAQQTYDNVNACFEALAAGEVQYVVCDATAGAYLARAYEGVSFVGILSTVSVEGLAVLSSSTELEAALSEAFEEMVSDGTLDAVHSAWYGTLPVSLSGYEVSGADIEESDDATDSDGELLGDINSLSS